MEGIAPKICLVIFSSERPPMPAPKIAPKFGGFQLGIPLSPKGDIWLLQINAGKVDPYIDSNLFGLPYEASSNIWGFKCSTLQNGQPS